MTDPRFSKTSVEINEEERWVVLRRGALSVLANLGETEARMPAPPGRVILAYPPADASAEGPTVIVPGHSVMVIAP